MNEQYGKKHKFNYLLKLLQCTKNTVVINSRFVHQNGVFFWFHEVSFDTSKNIKRCKSGDLQRNATK